MALGIEEKKSIVAEISVTAGDALSLVIADARGVSVLEMAKLRKTARENQVVLKVVKNSLAKRSFEGTDFSCVNDTLTGPSLFGFSMQDPGVAARLFKEFAKQNDDFEVKALSVGGQLLPSSQLDVLANLPTRDQALAQLCSVMIAPVTKLTRTFNDIPSQVVRVIDQVGKTKAA